jgi:PAS domain-containing protein
MDDRPADAVTARRVALHESTEHLRAVLETAVHGIILIDARGTVRIFNPACEKLFGYHRPQRQDSDAGAVPRRA